MVGEFVVGEADLLPDRDFDFVDGVKRRSDAFSLAHVWIGSEGLRVTELAAGIDFHIVQVVQRELKLVAVLRGSFSRGWLFANLRSSTAITDASTTVDVSQQLELH